MKKLAIFLVAVATIGVFAVSCQNNATTLDGGYDGSGVATQPADLSAEEGIAVSVEASRDSDVQEDYEVDGDDSGVMIGELSGNWGRHMYGAVDAGKGNEQIANWYACLRFEPIGSFVAYEWYTNGQKYAAGGWYSVEVVNGQKMVNWDLTYFTEPSMSYDGPEKHMLGRHSGYLIHEPGKGSEIRYDGTPAVFVEGVQWDFDEGHYKYDSTGEIITFERSAQPAPRKLVVNKFGETDFAAGEPKDSVHGVFPYESGDYRVEAVIAGGKIDHLRLTVDYRWDDKAGERKLALESLKKWLAKHGLPSYRIEVTN